MRRLRVAVTLAVTFAALTLLGSAPVLAGGSLYQVFGLEATVTILACSPESLPAFDPGSDPAVEAIIATANLQISQAIAKARHLAEVRPQDVQEIIDDLLDRVDVIVKRTIRAIGDRAIVICEYVLVEIGGQPVLVDPLKVAGS